MVSFFFLYFCPLFYVLPFFPLFLNSNFFLYFVFVRYQRSAANEVHILQNLHQFNRLVAQKGKCEEEKIVEEEKIEFLLNKVFSHFNYFSNIHFLLFFSSFILLFVFFLMNLFYVWHYWRMNCIYFLSYYYCVSS